MNNLSIYENRVLINSYQVDCDEVLSLPMFFCLCQETALQHVNRLQVGWNELSAQGMFWALSKMYVKIERMPRWDEEVLIRTWGRPHDVYTQPRDFEWFDASGNRVACVTSVWIVLDAATGKFQPLARIDDRLVEWDNAVLSVRAPKVRRMDFTPENAYRARVLFSDLDRNRHVNNTKYLQWLFDSPAFADRKVADLREVAVNFIAQARLGEEYSLQSVELQHDDVVSTVFSFTGENEYCRMETKWKE